MTAVGVGRPGAGADPAVDLAIRARRADFNAAIAKGDAFAIGPLLTRDCVMVTGSDSAVVAGRLAQVKLWAREFSAREGVVYVRTPGTVSVSPVEPMVLEQGAWTGSRRADGAVVASGLYSAKWRETGGQWVIEAELFVTMG